MKKIFVSVSPGFYKNNLFSELNKKIDIKVVYTTSYDEKSRNIDFMKGDKDFPYIKLEGSMLKQCWIFFKMIKSENYDECIAGDYNSICSWVHIFFSPKKKNSVIIESTFRETKTRGLKSLLKRFYFSRVSKAYVCGSAHAKLTKIFGFKGENITWHSVGIFNTLPQPTYEERKKVCKFLYVGRFIPEKNLFWLIEQFEHHQELELDIIGFGEQELELRKRIKTKNIRIIGAVDNGNLPFYYRQTDVFILPSLTETWGLVIEEALNNGVPVMVSHMVGCADDLVIYGNTGVIFELNNIESFEESLDYITNIDNYNTMRKYISTLDFIERKNKIIKAFIK